MISLRPSLIFLVCLLQAIETGTFLTLDVTTKSLQQKWNFDLDQMVSIGTIGYSLGFFGVGLFNLCARFPIWVNILIAGTETSLCWFLIWFYLCPGCLPWYIAMLLEAGIGMGTAIAYTASVQIVSKHSEGQAKYWRLVLLALSVAIGSILAFLLFIELSSIQTVLLIMFGFSLTTTSLLLASAFIPVVASEDKLEETGETRGLLVATNNPSIRAKPKYKFTKAFGIYLLGINLIFGVLMTFINSANSILYTFGKRWSSQSILIFFVLGNFGGRLISLWLKNHLPKMLWLFALFSCLLGIFQGLLLPFWNIEIVLIILILSSFFFGIIWAITMPLAREFFSIEEAHSLGLVFFGMAGGPIIFGSLASWLYSLHHSSSGCIELCFEVYFTFASLASFLASACYLASWYLVWKNSA